MGCSACQKRKQEMLARQKTVARNKNGARVPPRSRPKSPSAIRPIKPTARRRK